VGVSAVKGLQGCGYMCNGYQWQVIGVVCVCGVVKMVRLQRVGTGETEWHFEGFQQLWWLAGLR